ncbi:MAG: acetate--CoA ligase alpha subunit [Anaerolineae bacterium]
MLEAFFCPQSVAVIGASRDEKKLGHGILRNLIEHGYQGEVYPVNPKADDILERKSYPSVLEVADPPELAVIAIPAPYVADALEECGQAGVKGVIVISAGFGEVGGQGIVEEKRLVEIVRRYGMRMLGPNCLGLIDTITPLNASFAVGMPERGELAFMSQSGALCSSILDWARGEGKGFSHFVSLGNKADLTEIDFLRAWGDDPHTKVIIAYLEGIADGHEFMEVAQMVARHTPIIAIKSGTTSAGSRAVSSHTGTLAGSERAYDAAFNQAGVIRATSVEDLFDLSIAFAYQPLLAGDGIAIVTNAGGPGIMTTDAIERAGLRLASLEQETVEYLREHLPAAANVLNPVDVLGDAFPDRYGLALEAVLQDRNVQGVIVILAPQVMTRSEETAEVIGQVVAKYDKPVFGCFMGQVAVGPGIKVLNQYRVPNYLFPERAVGAMRAMSHHRRWLERPLPETVEFTVNRSRVQQLFNDVRADGRLAIGDAEARDMMQAYGLPIPRSRLATSQGRAVKYAEEIGYPVAMKIVSPDILHKTDIGGVKLNVGSAEEVRQNFAILLQQAMERMPQAEVWGVLVQEMVRKGREVIIGMSRDPQFGPLIMFGLGGIYVEVLEDVTFRIAPLSRLDAEEMIKGIRSYPLLRGVRGEKPADTEAMVDVLLRVSQMVTDFSEIVELDINPLVVYNQGAVALDMRLALKG